MTAQISRARASKELGELFEAAMKQEHAHVIGVCAELGIAEWRHYEWMNAKAEPGTPEGDYRLAVIRGMNAARIADIKATDTAIDEADAAHCSVVWNSRKHRHESRFRRFYEEPAQKVELSGPEGAPLQVQALPSAQLAPVEVIARVKELAEAGDERALALLEAARK